MTAKVLALVAANLSLQERYGETESVCRMATDIDPDCDKSWIVWAQAILNQNDTDRLPEAQNMPAARWNWPQKNGCVADTLQYPGQSRALDRGAGSA